MSTLFLTAGEAVDQFVAPGSIVGIGGMHMTSAPMNLVREVVRREIAVSRLVTSPSSSIQADILIGAGLVGEIMSPYVGFEHLGLAPAFRRAVEGGELVVRECDEGSLTHSLYAGAGGLPYVPCPPGIESTDIPGVNPDLYRRATDPFTGEDGWVVGATRPDVVLISCARVDEDGNVAFDRFPFTDRLMALAARCLVVQVEEIVASDELARLGPAETIPSFLVAAVVVSPGGCHPTASPGYYDSDEDSLVAYMKAAADPDALAEWMERTEVGR